MNWGNKILIVIISFVVLILTMVVISVNQDFDMVEENYYEKELAYQGQMDKEKNAQNWPHDISIKQLDGYLALLFDQADLVNGKIQFFRPSDASLDFNIPLAAETNIPIEKFASGIWKVSFHWEAEGKSYYKEEKIFIQK